MKVLSQAGGGNQVYLSPEVKIVLIEPEGVLCASSETEDYNYWEFEW